MWHTHSPHIPGCHEDCMSGQYWFYLLYWCRFYDWSIYPVCRDETASSWVCVSLGTLLTLPSHVFLERAVFWCSFDQCPRQAADRAEATAEDAAVSLRLSQLWFLEGGRPAARPQWCRLCCKEQQQLAAEWKAPAPADGFLQCPQWCKLTIPSGLALIYKDLLPRVRLKSFNKTAATQFHTMSLHLYSLAFYTDVKLEAYEDACFMTFYKMSI